MTRWWYGIPIRPLLGEYLFNWGLGQKKKRTQQLDELTFDIETTEFQNKTNLSPLLQSKHLLRHKLRSLLLEPFEKAYSKTKANTYTTGNKAMTLRIKGQRTKSKIPFLYHHQTNKKLLKPSTYPPAAPHKKKTRRRGRRGGRRRKKVSKDAETVKIYNLSHTSLTAYDLSLLRKGLTFAPTMQPNSFTLFKDLNKYIRDLTVQEIFQYPIIQTNLRV